MPTTTANRRRTELPTCEVHRLGRVAYKPAWDLQGRLAAEIAVGQRPPSLLLLEHPHTYTFGRAGRAEHLLWSEQHLEAHQVEVHWVDRGGDITYHGPGQLVGYPLLPLGKVDRRGHLPHVDYIGYLRKLEEVLIYTLAELGLVSGQLPGKTGVWVQPDVASRCPNCPPAARKRPSKIAAIGVKVDVHGVSRHGFALNVNPNMTYFQAIVPCGIPDYPVVSLAEITRASPTEDQVADRLIEHFGQVFGYDMRLVSATSKLQEPTR